MIGKIRSVQQTSSLPKRDEFPINGFQDVDGIVQIWVVEVRLWNIKEFFFLLEFFLGTSLEKAAFGGCQIFVGGDRELSFEGGIVQWWKSPSHMRMIMSIQCMPSGSRLCRWRRESDGCRKYNIVGGRTLCGKADDRRNRGLARFIKAMVLVIVGHH